jgi:hypothetical protein
MPCPFLCKPAASEFWISVHDSIVNWELGAEWLVALEQVLPEVIHIIRYSLITTPARSLIRELGKRRAIPGEPPEWYENGVPIVPMMGAYLGWRIPMVLQTTHENRAPGENPMLHP